MAAIKYPDDNFKFDKTQSGPKAAIKDNDAALGQYLKVAVDRLNEVEGFNVRVATPDYESHVESIKNSIIQNGFYSDKPLAGYAANEGEHAPIYITDGHTRLEAVRRAIKGGAKIETVPVILKPPGTSPEDLMVSLVTSNSGRPLNPLEVATVVKRLIGYGLEKDDITNRLSITGTWFDNLMLLAGAPKAVRDRVVSGEVAASVAIQTIKDAGAEAGAVLAEASKAAKAAGKTKVTAKTAKAAAAKTPKPPKPAAGKAETKKIVVAFRQDEVRPFSEIEDWQSFEAANWWEHEDETAGTIRITRTMRFDLKVKISPVRQPKAVPPEPTGRLPDDEEL